MSTKQLLQSTIYKLLGTDPFLGNLIQEVNLTISNLHPTAWMGFDKKTLKFQMGVNPEFFEKLSIDERAAVIKHELAHFIHSHLTRMKFEAIPHHERVLWNIAADMAINQSIQHLPKGCVDIKDWKAADGSPLAPYKTMEYYFDALKASLQHPNNRGKKGENTDFNDDFNQRKESQDKDENGQPKWGSKRTGSNDETYDKYKPFDEHDWDELLEDEKQKYLKEMKDTFERTIEKSSNSHTTIPDSVKELLKQLEAQIKELDYKGILKRAIKKSVTVADRSGTWNRPNKRYGVYAPGTTVGKLPSINIYIDTSGSMSIRELNEALKIMDGFLSVGGKNCHLGLWNTDLYHFRKRKIRQSFENDVQGGGTNVAPVLEHIKKHNPELSLIITDGYFDKVDLKITSDVIWIIRGDCNLQHPNVNIGKTISYDSIK